MPIRMSKSSLDKINLKYSTREVAEALISEFENKQKLEKVLETACISTNLLVPRNYDSPESISGALITVWSAVLEHEFRIITNLPSVEISGIYNKSGKETTRVVDFCLRSSLENKEIPIELKATRGAQSPMIKGENIGNFILFVKFDDRCGRLSAGIIQAKIEFLNPGKNRDSARTIKKSCLKHIHWVVYGYLIPHASDKEFSEMQRAYIKSSVEKMTERFASEV